MSSYCPSCGTALREGAKFCGKCGTKVEGIKPTKPVRTIQTTHSSKTKVVVLAVVIIVVAGAIGYLLFSNLFQSGMIQNNTSQTDTTKFIGSWKSTVKSGMINADGSVDTLEVIWTFNDNGTIKVTGSSTSSDVQWFNYEIKNNQLCYIDAEGVSFCMDYQFSNNDNCFTIKLGGTTQIFDRIGGDISKFIGKWKGMTGTDTLVYYTFYTNGTTKMDYTDSEGETTIMWTTYWVNGSNIYFANGGSSPPESYVYEFSNNDTQIVLSQNGTPWIIASKVQ